MTMSALEIILEMSVMTGYRPQHQYLFCPYSFPASSSNIYFFVRRDQSARVMDDLKCLEQARSTPMQYGHQKHLQIDNRQFLVRRSISIV